MTPPTQRREGGSWSVYLIRCGDGSLYTGIATDVERRVEEHRGGGPRAAKYLRGRGPLEIVLQRRIGDRGRALRIEARIKRLSRVDKEALILDPSGIEALDAACD